MRSRRAACSTVIQWNLTQRWQYNKTPYLVYLGNFAGLRWLCMHLLLNLINWSTDIQEKLKLWKSMCKVNGELHVLLWYHRFWQSSVQRGQHTKVCIILLNGLSKCAQHFTVGFLKLLSTHPIHIVVWGNFPFKEQQDVSYCAALKALLFHYQTEY